MKILNSLFLIFAAFFIDLSVNGIIGHIFCLTTPFFYSYFTSFFAHKMVRAVSALFVIMQAMLYGAATPLFCGFVVSIFFTAPFFNRRLRPERWVRWLLASLFFFIILCCYCLNCFL